MNSRSVTGVNFARQLAAHHRETQQPPTKRFRSSAAPKGTKLPSGYQDRAQLRQTQQEDNAEDLAQRIKALEEMVKEGKIDQATFEKVRGEMRVGGDVGSTHMVKGLDWELLKRVKAGEDVTRAPEKKPEEREEEKAEEAPGDEELDLEAEFERVTEEKGREEIAPVAPKEKKEKKGTMAPPPAPAQTQKKSRDEILRQLKASRAAPTAQPAPPPESKLGSKFKKLGDSRPEKKRWVETDENGRRREVLLITDVQGNTKRKTRWLDKPGESNGLLVPDKDAKPLGMEVPAEVASKAAAAAPAEDEDDDIFEGVGADYNPLADIGEDDSSSDSDEEGEVADKGPKKTAPTEPSALPSTEQPSRPRNYFSATTRNDTTEEDEDRARANPLTRDPTLLAALKRAAALRQASPSAEGGEGEKRDDSRSQRFLEEMRRREAQDAMDMDMGFGGSRIEDEEDDEFIGLEGRRGGQKRKRGPKKRKGDKENASDVLGVLEGRKQQ